MMCKAADFKFAKLLFFYWFFYSISSFTSEKSLVFVLFVVKSYYSDITYVSNHRKLVFWGQWLFQTNNKNTSMLRITGPLWVANNFSTQRAGNVDSLSMSWCLHNTPISTSVWWFSFLPRTCWSCWRRCPTGYPSRRLAAMSINSAAPSTGATLTPSYTEVSAIYTISSTIPSQRYRSFWCVLWHGKGCCHNQYTSVIIYKSHLCADVCGFTDSKCIQK